MLKIKPVKWKTVCGKVICEHHKNSNIWFELALQTAFEKPFHARFFQSLFLKRRAGRRGKKVSGHFREPDETHVAYFKLMSQAFIKRQLNCRLKREEKTNDFHPMIAPPFH